MKMLLPLCVLPCLAAPVTGQLTASTLHRLSRAACIAEVKVLAARVDRGTRFVVFKTLRALKGSPPATFTLAADDGRMCGSVLHGLVPGTGHLAFLESAASGPRLAVPSRRALVPLHPEVCEHVKSLLEAESSSPVDVLTRALAADHPRVRQDAAHALPLLRDLRCRPDDRRRILAALEDAMRAGEKSSASLILAARRLRLPGAVDTLLPHYLAGSRPGLEPLLVETMADIDGERTARGLLGKMPSRPRQQLLAVRLLAGCSGADATRCLQQLLLARNGRVQARAAAALLDRGCPARDIRRRAGTRVLNAGRQVLRHRRKRLLLRSIRLGKDD